jgi:hypothetical protein
VFQRLAEESSGDLTQEAIWLSCLSTWLSCLGRIEEALAAMEKAVAIGRLQAKKWPGAVLPPVAESLNNLSNRLFEVGRPWARSGS